MKDPQKDLQDRACERVVRSKALSSVCVVVDDVDDDDDPPTTLILPYSL